MRKFAKKLSKTFFSSYSVLTHKSVQLYSYSEHILLRHFCPVILHSTLAVSDSGFTKTISGDVSGYKSPVGLQFGIEYGQW